MHIPDGFLTAGVTGLAWAGAGLGVAAAVPARHRTAWLTAFALLQGWGAALFFTWREFI
jgi:ABC-type Co2+ transport system permease subunit